MYEDTIVDPTDLPRPTHNRVAPVATPFGLAELRALGRRIGADGFSVFIAGPLGATSRLVPIFDCQFPGLSVLSRRLTRRDANGLAELALGSACPVSWSAAAHAAQTDTHWLRMTPPPPGVSGAGLLLPVDSECGRAGIVAFAADSLTIDEGIVAELHWECFALFARIAPTRPLAGGKLPAVSKRELECLKLTANGLTSDEIARNLGLSVHTANQYLTNSSQKLNAMNRIHAVAKALRLGLID